MAIHDFINDYYKNVFDKINVCFDDLWYSVYKNNPIMITKAVLQFLYNQENPDFDDEDEVQTVFELYHEILVNNHIPHKLTVTSPESFKLYTYFLNKKSTIITLSIEDFKKSFKYLRSDNLLYEFAMLEKIKLAFNQHMLEKRIGKLKKIAINLKTYQEELDSSIKNLEYELKDCLI